MGQKVKMKKNKQLMYDFNITEEVMNGVNIIFASYTYKDYSGDAFVLFIKDNNLKNPLSILSWDIEVSTLSGKFD